MYVEVRMTLSRSRKRRRRKGPNIEALVNPTFPINVNGRRQRMSAFEIAFRQQIKIALEGKKAKPIYDLLELFLEHKAIQPGPVLPNRINIPWYWDFEDYMNFLKRVRTTKDASLRWKPKFVEPLTEAGRKDMDEQLKALFASSAKTKPKREDVGYKRPPAEKQFKKGESGNPKGRRPAANDRKAIILKVANEKVPITEQGKSSRVRIAEALLIALRNLAVGGRAAKLYAIVIQKLLPQNPNATHAIWYMHEGPPHEEFLAQVRKNQRELVERGEELKQKELEVFSKRFDDDT